MRRSPATTLALPPSPPWKPSSSGETRRTLGGSDEHHRTPDTRIRGRRTGSHHGAFLVISPDHLRDACERAARYRRQLAIETGNPPGNLRERIDIVPAVREEPVGDGWLRAGVVADDIEAAILTVYWHPGTDRVKVQRPPDPNAIPTPSLTGRPGLTVSLGVRRAYRASPGYRYVLDGVEHSPEEAERIATERDTITGWTWRRTDAEP